MGGGSVCHEIGAGGRRPEPHRQGHLALQPGSPGCSLASPVLCSLRVTDTPFLFGNFDLASWASPLLPFLKEAVLSQKCSLAGDRQTAHRPAVLVQGKASSRLPVKGAVEKGGSAGHFQNCPFLSSGGREPGLPQPLPPGRMSFPSLHPFPSCVGQYFLKGNAHTSSSRH